ncbi:hypothetical protein RYX36_031075 [Vicia faba]
MVLCIQNVLSAYTSKNTIDMVDDIDIKDFRDDPLGWTMKLLKHPFGDFSMAAVQANEDMEDFSQDVVDKMEKRFMLDADELHHREPQRVLASSGCLCCIIWKGILYIANVGDSRAVMGSLGPFDILCVRQLVRDHNAGNKHVKKELTRLHPDDPDIVKYDNDAWRVAGVSEGIAKRLVRIALEIAARQKNISYSELLKVPKDPSVSVERTRRSYHDDISVTVVFLDKKPDIDMSVMPNVIPSVPRINSFRSFYDKALFSNFRFMYTRDREPMVIHSTLASDAILY